MSAPPDPDSPDRPSLERIVPELLRKVIETGTKNLSPDALRTLLGEIKLPKEAFASTISHLDETRQGVYRAIAKEVRELFDRTTLSDEIAKALSLLTLEVKMEVRFKPSSEGGRLTPSVRIKRSEAKTSEPTGTPSSSGSSSFGSSPPASPTSASTATPSVGAQSPVQGPARSSDFVERPAGHSTPHPSPTTPSSSDSGQHPSPERTPSEIPRREPPKIG